MDTEPTAEPAVPVARSTWECQTFLSLAECPACGGVGSAAIELLACQRGGTEIWQYTVECLHCGHEWPVEFALSAEPEPAYPAFGGAAPSQLVDAGQFLALAEESAEQVPADPAELDAAAGDELGLDEACDEIAIAVAAVEEVLKFIPAGDAAVPREALWTVDGVARYDRDPQAFQRRTLMATLGAYREVLAAYSRVSR